jgi:hypothetical protein
MSTRTHAALQLTGVIGSPCFACVPPPRYARGLESDVLDLADDARDVDRRRVIDDLAPRRQQRDRGRVHAGERVQRALDGAAARRAGHAADGEELTRRGRGGSIRRAVQSGGAQCREHRGE